MSAKSLKTIYIQSKSGDYNTTTKDFEEVSLPSILKHFRTVGGYYAQPDGRYGEIFVPFEEIEFIAVRRPD